MSGALRGAWLALAAMVACAPGLRSAQAADVGRLFLAPADRMEIDRLRQEAALQPPAPAPGSVAHEPPPVAEPPPPPGALTVNGYVARSSGAPTVWINGAETTGADLSLLGVDAGRLRINADSVRLPRSDGAAPLALKPGQSFDPVSKQITDAYEHTPPP